MAVNIRDLRQRIQFQFLSRTADGQGGWNEVWAPLVADSDVWAKIKPVSAKERYFSQRIEENISHQIIIRWKEGLTSEMRILFENRIFQIHGIRRDDERRFFMTLDCEEGVGS